jgi:hypothetical protein
MANKIILNHPRYKGEYEFDIDDEDAPLTNLEWRWVKKISGYLPLTFNEGWEGRDPDLFVAFAVITLFRVGKIQASEAMTVAASFDALPFGESVTLVAGEEDEVVEETPPVPAEAPVTERPMRSTGPSSRPTLEGQDDGLSRIGVLA